MLFKHNRLSNETFHLVMKNITWYWSWVEPFQKARKKNKRKNCRFFTSFSQLIGHSGKRTFSRLFRKLKLKSKSQNIPIRLIGLTLPPTENVSAYKILAFLKYVTLAKRKDTLTSILQMLLILKLLEGIYYRIRFLVILQQTSA